MENNVNKITILNINGKKKDRLELVDRIGTGESYLVADNSRRHLSNCSTRQIIRKIKAYDTIPTMGQSSVMIFENINPIVIQNIGDELDNMILDIHLNKYNKKIASQQIQEVLELLEKL